MGTVDGTIWEDPEEVLGNREGAGGLVRDPVKDNVIRWVAAGADISSLTVFRAGDSLWVGIELRRPPSPTYDYRVYLRAVFPDGESTAHIGRWGVARRGGLEAVRALPVVPGGPGGVGPPRVAGAVGGDPAGGGAGLHGLVSAVCQFIQPDAKASG